MTDNEIIKALECCFGGEGLCPRQQCPFYEKCKNDESLAMYALDLINRQKAEIKEKDEMLSAQADIIRTLERVLEDKKAEIERLQKRLELAEQCITEVEDAAYRGGSNDYIDSAIDRYNNLVKEMTEEGK